MYELLIALIMWLIIFPFIAIIMIVCHLMRLKELKQIEEAYMRLEKCKGGKK